MLVFWSIGSLTSVHTKPDMSLTWSLRPHLLLLDCWAHGWLFLGGRGHYRSNAYIYRFPVPSSLILCIWHGLTDYLADTFTCQHCLNAKRPQVVASSDYYWTISQNHFHRLTCMTGVNACVHVMCVDQLLCVTVSVTVSSLCFNDSGRRCFCTIYIYIYFCDAWHCNNTDSII